MAKLRRRLVGSIAYGSNSTVLLDLPREYIATRLWLELTGNLVNGVAAAAAIINEAPQRLIRRVALKADGETMQVWEGGMLFAFWAMLNGVAADRQAPVVGVGTQPFRAMIPLCFEAIRTGNPSMTYLVTRRFLNLQLEVTWGTDTDIATPGGGGTSVVSAVNLDVVSDELMNRPEALGLVVPYKDLIVGQLTEQPSGAASEYRIKLPKQDPVRGFFIRCATQANNGRDLSNTVLNSLIVRERVTLDTFRTSFDELRSINQAEYGIAQDFETPGTGFRFGGYVFVDNLKTGPGDVVSPRGFSEYDLVVDCDANTHLTIAPISIRGAESF